MVVLIGEPDNVERIWLLSIRHSGTHYMWKHFQTLGYEQCIVFWDKMTQRNPTGPQQYLHSHLDIGFEYNKYLTDEKCVIPMRHPVATFRTFIYRYWSKWKVGKFEPHLIGSFARLADAVERFNSFIYFVDMPDQHIEFEKFVRFLGCNRSTYKQQDNNVATAKKKDFTKRNGFPKQMVELYNNPPGSIFELARQYGY